MAVSSVSSRPDPILRVLCVIVFLTMVLAGVYAAWIGIVNFSRIGV